METINLGKNHEEFNTIAKAIKFLDLKQKDTFRGMLYFNAGTLYASDGKRMFKAPVKIAASGLFQVIKCTKSEIVLQADKSGEQAPEYEECYKRTPAEKLKIKNIYFDVFAQKLIRQTRMFFNLEYLRNIWEDLSKTEIEINYGDATEPLKFRAKGQEMLLMPIIVRD